MADNKLNKRIAKTVRAKSNDCITKPLDIKKYKVLASEDEEKENIIEENIIAEFKSVSVGKH